MKILLDILEKDVNLFFQKICIENDVFLVSKLNVLTKFKNVYQILELDKLCEYDIDIFIVSNYKNIKYYENYISTLKSDKKCYVFSRCELLILNPNCEYHKTIKLNKMYDIIPQLFKKDVIQKIHENNDKNNDKNNLKIVEEKEVSKKESVKKKDLKDVKKDAFRQICLSYLEKIRTMQMPNDIKFNSNNEAVLIEYRILPHVEVLLRNTILQLGNKWSYTIICGRENYSFMKQMAGSVDKNIKVVNSNHKESSQNEYNILLLSKQFWHLLTGEKILIYQEDSFIFKSNIDDFLSWDYIGAPFAFKCIEPHNVGNGGFSLRSKSKMLEVLTNCPINEIDYNNFSSNVLQYKRKQFLDLIPEDVYFSQSMQVHNIGKVSDFETATKFSSETFYDKDSLGMHCMWYSCKNWKDVLTQYFEKLTSNNNKLEVKEKMPLEVKEKMPLEVKEKMPHDTIEYLDKIEQFCKLMNIDNKDDVFKNSKQEFRYFCYNYMEHIRMLELPIIKQNGYYEAVLIEFRCLPHLEFLIRNAIYKIGENWCQTIVCGLNNYEFILNIVNNINRDIKVIKTDYYNVTQNEYSNMLMTREFWDLFSGEKILIYQEDTCIFKSNIADFLEWDYIGAPWPKKYKINNHSVGNGGFSLRSKSVMIECCKYSTIKLIIPTKVEEYIKENNLDNIPEDVYFTTTMELYSIGKIADYESALKFSVETILNNDSFGGHQFWLQNKSWKLYLYDNIIKTFQPRCLNPEQLEHRGGWSSVIDNIYNLQLYYNHSNIIFYDVLEKDFLWDPSVIDNKKWFGIIHCTENTPNYLNIINISNLFVKNSKFLNNIHNCLFLIALAPNVIDYLKKKFDELNIHVDLHLIKHPIDHETGIPFFSIDKYIKNTNKTIIQIGQQLRKMTSIYLLNTNLKKLWLTGTKNHNKIYKLFQHECKYLNLGHLNINDVPNKYTETFAEYDELLSENIVFIDLFDAAANNTVLECILRQTPILVNKIPATIYYLGENYPMFFEKLEDIPNLITIQNIKKTHNYLKTVDTINTNEFISRVVNILNKK
jgi:hypothetical protein